MNYAPAMMISSPPPGSRTIDQVLSDARVRLGRLGPQQAQSAVSHGAVLVDIRPAAQRAGVALRSGLGRETAPGQL